MPQSAEDNFTRLKRLFPGLTEEEYVRLDHWYTGYAALIFRMFKRITGDPEAYDRFLALTDKPVRPSMTEKVDSPNETTS
jgi:hypothetical protein